MPKITKFISLAFAVATLVGSSVAATAQNDFGFEPPITGSWNGFYLGAHAGGGTGDMDLSDGTDAASIDQDGFVIGAHIGYNVLFNSLMFGIEADVSYNDAEKTFSDSTVSLSIGSEYLASIRARAGFATDTFLVYATAGVAFSNLAVTVSSGSLAATADQDLTGFVVGGGGEMKFTNNLSGRLEALYFGFEDDIGATNVDLSTTVIRAGITYHFN